MNVLAAGLIRDRVDELYRTESRRVFATLVRMIGDFDLAEEVMHEAFASAVEQWQTSGIPASPRAWLVSTGRFKAIDIIRRRTRFDNSLEALARDQASNAPDPTRDDEVEDDRLRLIFTCCHPSLAPPTQVALTLREVCGLSTEAIASAFLSSVTTIQQRIVRGKAKIRDARIPYYVPPVADLPQRLESVLAVIYLVFNEGYYASSGNTVMRADLSEEAIRLGRLVVELLPDSEAIGLLALMLLQESRRAARANEEGDLILLEEQDRARWNRQMIDEGSALVRRALASPELGTYSIQSAIAAVHAAAPTTSQTDWQQIVELYDLLARAQTSPVVLLNRAVAVAMRDGPEAGLALIDELLTEGDLTDYHLAHAARADLCRRLGQQQLARESYARALKLAKQEPERRFLERRLRELAS